MGGRAPRTRVANDLGGEQIEGRRAVAMLLEVGVRRVRELWLSDRADGLAELAREVGARVAFVTASKLEDRARSAAPQGVIAFADPVPEADVDELLADPSAFLVAVDGVTDPGNLGAILRSAEAAGATGAVIPRHRNARITPTVAKAAAGAIETLPLASVSGTPAFLERAKRAQVWSVGLDEHGGTEVFDLDLGGQPLVAVFGAEGRGLSPLTAKRCDVLARIPMRGQVESLNVSAAAAVAMYAIAATRTGSA